MHRFLSLGLSISVALSLALVGCATNSGTGPGGDDDDTSGPDAGGSGSNPGGSDAGSNESGSVAPAPGMWRYDQVTPTTNTCGTTIGHAASGPYTISAVTTTGFTVVDGSDTFTCTLDATGFTCPQRASTVYDAGPQFNAVFTGHATAAGHFPDATHGAGTQDGTVTCAGTDCALVAATAGATVPCTLDVSFTTSLIVP